MNLLNHSTHFMKTYLSFLLCLASFNVLAQEPVAPNEIDPPKAPAPAVAPLPPVVPIPELPALPAIVPLKAIAQAVHASQATAMAQVKEAVEKARSATARLESDLAMELAGPGGRLFLSRGSKPGRTLIVPVKSLDASITSALEEDLNVMARILEKAIERKSDDDNPKAMGIDLFSMGSSSGVRNLYLDGHGVLFILKARFPLVAPPEKTESSKTNEPTSSTWTEAWRDLYGPKGDWSGDFGKSKDFGFGSGSSAEEYDADKVENLKVSILDALKNATNIRHLKSDEKVTVVVTSTVGSADVKAKRIVSDSRGARAGAYAVERHESRKGEGAVQSALTIHAKKSDIDAFAKGKLTLEEFRKKATVIIN